MLALVWTSASPIVSKLMPAVKQRQSKLLAAKAAASEPFTVQYREPQDQAWVEFGVFADVDQARSAIRRLRQDGFAARILS